MGCGVIILPEGADARKIRDGFVPQLQLAMQVVATVKSDMSVPVIETLMPDDLYLDFKADEHLENMKVYNPIFATEMFVVHRCTKMDKGRLLKIKTTEAVLQYLMDKDFEVPYTSGEVQFIKEVNWTAVKEVCTLPPPTSEGGKQAEVIVPKQGGQMSANARIEKKGVVAPGCRSAAPQLLPESVDPLQSAPASGSERGLTQVTHDPEGASVGDDAKQTPREQQDASQDLMGTPTQHVLHREEGPVERPVGDGQNGLLILAGAASRVAREDPLMPSDPVYDEVLGTMAALPREDLDMGAEVEVELEEALESDESGRYRLDYGDSQA